MPERGEDDQDDDDDDDESVRERKVRLELSLSERTDQLLLNQTRSCRRDRSPSTASLPVVQEMYCCSPTTMAARRATMVANESAASLIGSDSALLVKDKPPLPRYSRMMMMTKKKSLQPRGMDPDDSLEWEEEEVETGSSSSTRKRKERNVFSGALAALFKAR